MRLHPSRFRHSDDDLRIHGIEEKDFDLDDENSLVRRNPGHIFFSMAETTPVSPDAERQRQLNIAALGGERPALDRVIPDPSDRRHAMDQHPFPRPGDDEAYAPDEAELGPRETPPDDGRTA